MDREASWWTTNGNLGLTPLARVMGLGRQQICKLNNDAHIDQSETNIINNYDCFNNFDRSHLGNIDPDSNYLINTNQLKDILLNSHLTYILINRENFQYFCII